ncbi:sensory rhodopsin transducer [Micromonospora sp. KC606]|uniref:sensory rhodopsin transducer n=1 Tax=Micromonospora sp. KC606 TaxID=2530379 RepID=UPI001A9DAC5E|nr:sensory rhodopsin transducer [Micromonospora sp. KC606]
MGPVGARVWVVPGGHIPFPTSGPEPEFSGFDQLCVLNATDDRADVRVHVYYTDAEPVGPYLIPVAARRVRHVRVNDLVDPEAVRLDRPYGLVLRSPVPVVVQFLRQDTRLPGVVALTGTMAHPEPAAPDVGG